MLESEGGEETDVKLLPMLNSSEVHGKPVDTWKTDYLLKELVALGEEVGTYSLVAGANS